MNVNKALFTFIKIGVSLIMILVLLYWAVKLCSVSYDYGYRLFTETPVEAAPGRDVLVQVKSGMSNRELSVLLEEKGLVRDSRLFYVQLMLSDYKHDIKPGVYTLNTSMEPKELMIAISPDVEESRDTETEELAPPIPAPENTKGEDDSEDTGDYGEEI